MRAISAAAAFVLMLMVAGEVQAQTEGCQKCKQYFSAQALEWCWECVSVYCGMFNCDIYEHPAYGEYCDGDEGCFETGRGCAFEPDVSVPELRRAPRLADRWRLTRVRTYRTDNSARSVAQR